MEKNDFSRLETMCQFRFLEAGSCFHVCSQENHPVLFHNEEEFKAAMNAVAFAGLLFQDIRIFTFEVMDNHFHFAFSGEKTRIKLLLRTLVNKLASLPSLADSSNDIVKLNFRFYEINNLDNLRNVITYINRNGAVISSDENVFTYKWGLNRFFFNTEAKLRHTENGKAATCREKRILFQSNKLESNDKVLVIDGYVSPLCFCRVEETELFFRNSRNYFYCISRNIESSKDIAKMIGEKLFYSDEDLFVHVRTACSKEFGVQTVSMLPNTAKVELAKRLHFDFNAGNKQISRLLKMDLSVVSELFPSPRNLH